MAFPPRAFSPRRSLKRPQQSCGSRILGWGFNIIEALQKDESVPLANREALARVDINQVMTGTVDSLCEQLLRDYRDPGTQPPILADDFCG